MSNYVVEDYTKDRFSMIYDRQQWTPWIITIPDMKDEEQYLGSYRTTMRGGKECEQFTLLPAKNSDDVLVQIQIFKNGDVSYYSFIPASIEINKRKKMITIQLHCNVRADTSGKLSIEPDPEFYS